MAWSAICSVVDHGVRVVCIRPLWSRCGHCVACSGSGVNPRFRAGVDLVWLAVYRAWRLCGSQWMLCCAGVGCSGSCVVLVLVAVDLVLC